MKSTLSQIKGRSGTKYELLTVEERDDPRTQVDYVGASGNPYWVVFHGPNNLKRAQDYIKLIENEAYYSGLER